MLEDTFPGNEMVSDQLGVVLKTDLPEDVALHFQSHYLMRLYCPIAQLAERWILVPEVLGSTPSRAAARTSGQDWLLVFLWGERQSPDA